MPPKRGRKRTASVSPSTRATAASISPAPPPPTAASVSPAPPPPTAASVSPAPPPPTAASVSLGGRDMITVMRVPRNIIEKAVRDTETAEAKEQQEKEAKNRVLLLKLRTVLEKFLFGPGVVGQRKETRYNAENDELHIKCTVYLLGVQQEFNYKSSSEWLFILENMQNIMPEDWDLDITPSYHTEIDGDVPFKPMSKFNLSDYLASYKPNANITFFASGPRSKIEI